MIKCEAFKMNADDALRHIRNNWEVVEDFGDFKYDHPLHTWDDGKRILGKCKECGQLILLQKSEYHDFNNGDDSSYVDYFAVSSIEEADELNKRFDGYDLEFECDKKWLCVTNGKSCWQNEDSEE